MVDIMTKDMDMFETHLLTFRAGIVLRDMLMVDTMTKNMCMY